MKIAPHQIDSARFYPCPKCGVDHPSSTTLLSTIANPALTGWMAKNGTTKLKIFSDLVMQHDPELHKELAVKAESKWSEKENTPFWKSGREWGKDAADFGTLAHAWWEAHLHKKNPDLNALPEPSRIAVNSFLKWEKENSFEVIATEETFVNCNIGYAGTADVVAKLNGVLSLGDWKTSNDIYASHLIQTWSYALADESQHGDRLYQQIFVGRFGKDGTYEVRVSKRNEFPSIDLAREVMLACGTNFRFNQEWNRRYPYIRKEKGAKK